MALTNSQHNRGSGNIAPDYNERVINMKDLLKVKSIVTILLTMVICYQAVIGQVDLNEIYLMIIAFYFGTQHEKNRGEING